MHEVGRCSQVHHTSASTFYSLPFRDVFLAHQHFSRVAGTLLRWRAPLVADISMFCLPAFLSPCLKHLVDSLKAANGSQQSWTGHWEHWGEFLVLPDGQSDSPDGGSVGCFYSCEQPSPHPHFPERQHVNKESTGTCLFFATTSTVVNYNMPLYHSMSSYWFLCDKSQKVSIRW